MTCKKHSSRRARAAGSWRRAALACAALVAAVACQTQPAPEVHSEPQKLPAAATRGAEAPPAAASASVKPPHVHEAKYDEGSPEGLPSEHAERSPVNAPSGAAEPVVKGNPTQGTVVSEEAFSAWLQAESPVAAGGAAAVEAVLIAKAPYHCNAEYPHKFKLNAPPAGLTYPSDVVKGMQVTAERGVLRIPVQAQSAGPATVSGTLHFSVCTDERCLVEKRDLTLNLQVR